MGPMANTALVIGTIVTAGSEIRVSLSISCSEWASLKRRTHTWISLVIDSGSRDLKRVHFQLCFRSLALPICLKLSSSKTLIFRGYSSLTGIAATSRATETVHQFALAMAPPFISNSIFTVSLWMESICTTSTENQ